jgi:AbrB family looped-hinge helix DNA binding protein
LKLKNHARTILSLAACWQLISRHAKGARILKVRIGEDMVIRRIDDLGRVQLPKDYRKTLDIYEGDELVIELKDGYISVTKYEAAKVVRI